MDTSTGQTLATAFLSIVMLAKILGDSWSKAKTERQTNAIKEEQTAHQILLDADVANRAEVSSTIQHLRQELTEAKSQATLAFAQSAKATEDNTQLQLKVQRLELSQEADRKEIAELKDAGLSLQQANKALTSTVMEQNKTISMMETRLTEVSHSLMQAQATIAQLSDLNVQLKKGKEG